MPRAASSRHMSETFVLPPVMQNVFALDWMTPTALCSRPCADTSAASCHGVRSLAQKYANEEMPGITSTSQPASLS